MQIKSRKNQVGYKPIWLAVLYVTGVLSDTFTTYITTPDLKYESNFLVKILHFHWAGLITSGTIVVIIILIGFFKSTLFLNKRDSQKQKVKLVLAYFSFTIFFFHLLYSYVIAINNLLSYFFLSGYRNCFYYISIQYIELIKKVPNYYFFLKVLIFGFACVVSILFIKKLKSSNFLIIK